MHSESRNLDSCSQCSRKDRAVLSHLLECCWSPQSPKAVRLIGAQSSGVYLWGLQELQVKECVHGWCARLPQNPHYV